MKILKRCRKCGKLRFMNVTTRVAYDCFEKPKAVVKFMHCKCCNHTDIISYKEV